MRFKVLAAAIVAAVLMATGAGVASAASRSSSATRSQTATTTDTTTTSLKPAANLVGDNAGTCALLRSGGVECWGDNALGALGDGTLVTLWYSQVPVLAKGLTGAISLVSDGVAYCALLRGGGVECWGDNTYGALGNGSGEAFSDVPVKLKGLTGAKSLVSDRNGYESGYGFCAVWGTGRVKCWGSNDALISGGLNGSGLLGDGTNEASTAVPVAVEGLTSVKSLASGQAGYCALLQGGGAKCWGDNDYNELGDGKPGDLAGTNPSAQVSSNVPVAVKELTGAVSLVGDGIGYCALLQSGGAKCWGNNSFGELGNGTKPNPKTNLGSDIAVSVKGLADGVSLVSTDFGYCALLRSGGAKCWGSNSFDELGHGLGSTVQAFSDVPVTVKGLAGAVSLVGGDDNGSTGTGYTYCATLKSRTAVCWGQNGYGELGDGGSEETSDVPVAVKGIAGIESLEVGTGSACAVLMNGGAECWGYGAGTVPLNLAGIGP